MPAVLPNFVHQVHRTYVPALTGRRETATHSVLIAGGGPVGLATALALAERGIATLVVEADNTVCVGSRAICLSRRTLEILDRIGTLAAVREKGLPWTGGRSFHRNQEVLHFLMPHDADQRLAPMTNIQQYHVEQFLLDAASRYPDLIEIRWGTRLDRLRQESHGVIVELITEHGSYETACDFVVACDGARSRVRQALGLRMHGTAYEGRYVIVDVEMALDLPTERLAWFDPPSAPGRTMLLHKQPDNLWRLDYQLHAHEDPEVMIREENVLPIVRSHLEMMTVDVPWRFVWISSYKASALSLDEYTHGRVLFAGDAAHLVPIFGVRGLNSGFDDAYNLAWKLASVLDGTAPADLLQTYSSERRHAWQINVASAMRSTEFMAPPSPGYHLMREAVLSLAKNHPALANLLNPRQSSAITYDSSILNSPTRDESTFPPDHPLGAPPRECVLLTEGHTRYFTEILGNRFSVLWYGEGLIPEGLLNEIGTAHDRGLAVDLIVVRPAGTQIADIRSADTRSAAYPGACGPNVGRETVDVGHRFRDLYNAAPTAMFLFRPDQHLCARWRNLQAGDLVAALNTALCRSRSL